VKDWKKLQRIEEELIKFLNEKFPPLEFDQAGDLESFKIEAVFRSGQRDIIKRLDLIREQQERG
jgi:hypothetical protein